MSVDSVHQDARAANRRLVSSATRGTKVKRLLWAGVEGTLFRGSFHTMNGWRAFLLRLFGARVGKRCIIRRTVRTYYPWNVTIGDMCIVGDRAEIYSLGKITIGKGAMISQEAYLCAGTHDYAEVSLPLLTPPIEIGAEAWICARAFVGPGVKIGEGAVVAACGVVVKDVEAWMMVGGNPAKVIKRRELRDGGGSGRGT
ncbi:MAG TPA: WcaF family extracellular polysaccharide biosynthesis acetyltransferase [Phycisphaerae bacterium]|nr:WcaF family extracellular polysaccharide biosynthesis acetyltransferase [Phycisphaerae bacterium]